MEKEKIDFEDYIFNLIIDEELTKGRIDGELHRALKEQHEQADITYKYTQVGFFFNYSVKDAIRIQDKTKRILGGIIFKVIDSPDKLIEVIMFICDGAIGCIEGHAYGDYIEEGYFNRDKLERVFI